MSRIRPMNQIGGLSGKGGNQGHLLVLDSAPWRITEMFPRNVGKQPAIFSVYQIERQWDPGAPNKDASDSPSCMRNTPENTNRGLGQDSSQQDGHSKLSDRDCWRTGSEKRCADSHGLLTCQVREKPSVCAPVLQSLFRCGLAQGHPYSF